MTDRRFLAGGALLVILSSVVLTSVHFPAPHTGGDNASYLSLAHSLVQGEGYTELWDPERAPHTKYPPGYPLALALLMALGASTWTAFKLFSAAAVSLAVLVTYAWASRGRGPIFGASVALLVLLSAGWLHASRWILSEPLFLVWTLLAVWAAERGLGEPAGEEEAGRRLSPSVWLVIAGAAAIAAFLTRSAGLPLVIAFAASLLLPLRWKARRGLEWRSWKGAALFAAAFLPVASWWFLRARRGGEGAYQSEFWMVNPYEPALGTIGVGALPGRVWENAKIYVGEVIPGEWWGAMELPSLLALGGVLLLGLAAWEWGRRVMRGPGVAELFVPLYLGLILLWPEVWSGDRFSLPLYPFLLAWAGDLVVRESARIGRAAPPITGAVLVLALALPALPGWLSMAGEAGECRRAAAGGDVFRCHGQGFVEFRDAAVWAGANLPAGSAVFTRKPSIFYFLGGLPGRTFPFTRDPDEFLRIADDLGIRYVLLDRVDGLAGYYLAGVIGSRLGAFCHLTGWGPEVGAGTDLFGILPPAERIRDGEGLLRCGASFYSSPASP